MSTAPSQKLTWRESLNIQQKSDTEFVAEFPADFCYGTRAHGGHLTSLMEKAARLKFQKAGREMLKDVMDIKAQWLRMTTVGEATIQIEDLMVGKNSATVAVRLLQRNKVNVFCVLTLGDLAASKGKSFETNWTLDPPPQPADLAKLANDEDPEWISYQVPWHPKSYLNIMSHQKMFFPYKAHSNLTIRDMWVTPVDSDETFGWTNENLSYIADMTFSPLENWQENGVASHDAMIAAAMKQKTDREAGKPLRAKISGLSPFTSYSSSMNIDIRKRLPDAGVKWLFTRTSSRQALNGRFDFGVTIHDESGALVAIVHIIHHIVELKDNPQPRGTNTETGKPRI